LNPRIRQRFDRVLEEVLQELPPEVHKLLAEAPLHVEDYPSHEVMDKTGAIRRDALCGLYTGIPIGHRSVEHSGTLPDVVTIYREGILAVAADRRGRVREDRLRREIRVTIFHELGHHHGLSEAELRQLGYG